MKTKPGKSATVSAGTARSVSRSKVAMKAKPKNMAMPKANETSKGRASVKTIPVGLAKPRILTSEGWRRSMVRKNQSSKKR